MQLAKGTKITLNQECVDWLDEHHYLGDGVYKVGEVVTVYSLSETHGFTPRGSVVSMGYSQYTLDDADGFEIYIKQDIVERAYHASTDSDI